MIRLQQILVPTDFSEYSDKALRYGVAFADQFGAALHLLHVVGHPTEYGFTGVAGLQEELRAKASARMDEIAGMWTEYNFPVHREILVGSPFVEIVRYAKSASTDMIVMGTHGRGPITHTLLGSVAEKVVRKSPCPVLTVRHPEHEFVMP